MEKLLINQADHFKQNFGEVLRSSAIFYYRESADFQTTISFMNYWKIKRDLQVGVVASVREMSGKLIKRERLEFQSGTVINYRPSLAELGLGAAFVFEGSIEIEVFCLKNLVIPYAAIMAIYESKFGISMVHSYARAYSLHEIEENRCISMGEEGCWTLKDTDANRSFGVFHNGSKAVSPQEITLRVISGNSQKREACFEIPKLNPYQTLKITPSLVIPDLVSFLGAKPGYANLSF